MLHIISFTKLNPCYTSRNYTGDAPLGALEAVFLKSFIDGRMGSGTNVVLDIHGWLNKTYGNSEVASYFGQQFGFSHNSTHGKGYLETWAFNQGAKSCLIELPQPASAGSIVSGNYAGKLTDGLVNMVQNIKGGSATEGGTVVNQSCRVQTNSSVNVRSGPGTSYSKVASLTNGTQVTRIKLGVATANGYVWDKIAMSDGKIGYMATNYLVLITDSSSYEKYQSYDEIMAVKAFLKYETDIYSGVIDKMYNNELIGAVEEWQKAFNLSVKDGSLNAETLQDMGFTVESNSKIVKNAFYNNYLGIANQFNRGDFCDDADNIFKFNSSTTNYSADFINNKNAGDNMWNEMDENERLAKKDMLNATYKKIKAASVKQKDDYVHGAAALGRFVDTNHLGETLTFQNVESLFDVSDKMRDTYSKAITRAMRAAEYFTQDTNTGRFAMNEYIGNRVGEGITGNRLDWFLAVNVFVFGTGGTVTKNGNNYSMALTFNVRDYYDWAGPDDDPMMFPIDFEIRQSESGSMIVAIDFVHEESLRDLHRAGMGKNFLSRGEFTINVSWTKGQSYADIKG